MSKQPKSVERKEENWKEVEFRAGLAVIVLGAIFLYIPIKAQEYQIPFWWLSLIYPVAVITAGTTKVILYR